MKFTLTLQDKMLGNLWDKVLIPNHTIMENCIDSYGEGTIKFIETIKKGKSEVHVFCCSRLKKILRVTL